MAMFYSKLLVYQWVSPTFANEIQNPQRQVQYPKQPPKDWICFRLQKSGSTKFKVAIQTRRIHLWRQNCIHFFRQNPCMKLMKPPQILEKTCESPCEKPLFGDATPKAKSWRWVEQPAGEWGDWSAWFIFRQQRWPLKLTETLLIDPWLPHQ